MDPLEGNAARSEYRNITNQGSSRNHLGHNYNNYNTNIYYDGLSQGLTEEERCSKAIVEHLWYPEIQHREDQIRDVDHDSYRWAFETWTTALRTWLEKGNNLFWVAGKAGSGKSTFMKFLGQHLETQRLLWEWADGKTLVTGAHYFWYAGTQGDLQRSREGLYRNLLYQSLEPQYNAAPLVFPERLNKMKKLHQQREQQQADWTNKELIACLGNLSKLNDHAFVFFIDGLDECYPAPDHGVLVSELEALSKHDNIKICVSSRPWKPFEPRFHVSASRLNLHDLTRADIEHYVWTELENAERDSGADLGIHEASLYRKGSKMLLTYSEHRPVSHLVDLITSRSEGVFLWVYLVLRNLSEEIAAGKQLRDLEDFVDEAPIDLMEYYKNGIWKRIGWRRERDVAMTFKIAVILYEIQEELPSDKREPWSLSFLHFWHLQQPDGLIQPDFAITAMVEFLSDDDVEKMLSRTRAFLGQVAKDLICIHDDVNDYDDRPHLKEFEFLHRSVLDYLTEPETQAWINERIPLHFQNAGFPFSLLLARLKLVPPRLSDDIFSGGVFGNIINLSGMCGLGGYSFFEQCTPSSRWSKSLIEIDRETVSQYEELAIHYLKIHNKSLTDHSHDYSQAGSSVAALFAWYGLYRFINEMGLKFPSLLFGYLQGKILLDVMPALITYPDSQDLQKVVKALLDLEVLSETTMYREFLILWWHLRFGTFPEAMTRSVKMFNINDASLGSRIWTVAKLFLRPGVGLESRQCLTHGKHNTDGHQCSVGRSIASPCFQITGLGMLSRLVPNTHIPEFRQLLSEYKDVSNRISFDKVRRQNRAAYLRKARDTALTVDRQVAEFRWSELEMRDAEWIWEPETTLHELNTYFCQHCGTDFRLRECFRWVCLSCLDKEYCTLCLPDVDFEHGREFQCLNTRIAYTQLQAAEFLAMDEDGLREFVDEEFENLGDSFEMAVKSHDSTKNLSNSEAKDLIYSIVRQHISLKRDYSYLQDGAKQCLHQELKETTDPLTA